MTLNPSPQARRILLAVDGSPSAECAARYLATYARALAPGMVTVLHVRTPPAGQPAAAGDSGHEMDTVETARDILKDAGIPFTWRSEPGEPAQTISRIATEEQADEIVMGSRGLGHWRGLVVGSVASRVLQQADVPVTIVRAPSPVAASIPATSRDVHRVLLAVDGSRHSLRATQYVCSLRESGMPIEVELLNVVGPIPPGYLQEFITQEKLEFYYQQEGAKALFEARALLESAGVKFSKHILAGYVMDKLIQVAAARNCSRIVMGSRGHGPMAGLMLGSAAYQAIHLSPIPVTLVK